MHIDVKADPGQVTDVKHLPFDTSEALPVVPVLRQRLHLEVEATESTVSGTLRQNALITLDTATNPKFRGFREKRTAAFNQIGRACAKLVDVQCHKRPTTESDLIKDLGNQMMIQPSNSQLLQARARCKERLKVRYGAGSEQLRVEGGGSQ
ncbi:hypothetical protein BGZ83_010399, partial [Gryganskiella cystojenkinii]